MRRIRLALPKGRLQEQALELLTRAGVCAGARDRDSRRLVLPDAQGKIDFIILKPIDIPVYVESGAIDMGIVGSDILRELEADVYEPLDLRIGACRLSLAAPEGIALSFADHLHIATKYPRTSERYFRAKNAHAEIIKLEGSVEIAPLLGLADAIVDLVETGRTLRENGLEVIEDIAQVSAKFIVNRTAMKLQSTAIHDILGHLDATIYANP